MFCVLASKKQPETKVRVARTMIFVGWSPRATCICCQELALLANPRISIIDTHTCDHCSTRYVSPLICPTESLSSALQLMHRGTPRPPPQHQQTSRMKNEMMAAARRRSGMVGLLLLVHAPTLVQAQSLPRFSYDDHHHHLLRFIIFALEFHLLRSCSTIMRLLLMVVVVVVMMMN